MCRNILLSLVAIITSLVVIITLVYSSLFWSINNPESYKSVLRENDVYEKVITTAKEGTLMQIESLTDNIPQGDEQLSDEEIRVEEVRTQITQSIVDNLISDIFTEEILQTTVEANIDNFFEYLNSDNPELTINLPVTKLRGYLENNLEDFVLAIISDGIEDYPICTTGQEAGLTSETFSFDLEDPPECRPSFFTIDEVETIVLEKINVQEQIDIFLNDNKLAALQDKTTLREFIATLQSLSTEQDDNAPDPDEVMNSLSQFRNRFQQLKLLSSLLFVIIAVLMLITVLLNYKQWSGALGWIGWSLIIPGVLMSIIFGIALVSFSEALPAILDQNVFTRLPDNPLVDELIPLLVNVIISIVATPLSLGLTLALVTLALGAVCLIIKYTLHRRSKNQPKSENELKSKMDSVNRIQRTSKSSTNATKKKGSSRSK